MSIISLRKAVVYGILNHRLRLLYSGQGHPQVVKGGMVLYGNLFESREKGI